jgi:hypothetical protein
MESRNNNNNGAGQMQSNLKKRTNGPNSIKDLESEFSP